jgi:ribonucleoside-diphosphate reductase alpha chain
MLSTKVVKRTGEVVDFDEARIRNAITGAIHAVGTPVGESQLDEILRDIVEEIGGRFTEFFPNVENIQDIVEKHLVRVGHYEIAKAYILYRAERQKIREQAKLLNLENARLGKLTLTKRDGRTVLLNVKKIDESIQRAAEGLDDAIEVDRVVREVVKNVYDGVGTDHLQQALVLAAATFIERDPAYSGLAAHLLLQKIYKEVLRRSVADDDELDRLYRQSFIEGIRQGLDSGHLDPRLGDFDLDNMANFLKPARDREFRYLGLQTLYERYFFRRGGRCVELPQSALLRIGMGLAVAEDDRETRAADFYELMSTRRYVPSTPTMFHAGTSRPQLSSCYLTTVEDDLAHIFKCLGDNSQLSKWSGGIGNDWSNIRGTGSPIKSTHVESQGVIPFLKIANDVTVAINRSGKRRGATCAYLETWHLDIEDFLDLRRNTGDERRRTHDMNTANWIPDLFMKRVEADEDWTLFSPDEVPDLHHLYGQRFERAYEAYEAKARSGEMGLTRTIPARKLWRKMLTMLFETGHPWMTFKDACNVRSPQDHAGVIHSSNLCTEITLNTSADETAVCNLGSVNLAAHMVDGELDEEQLASTVRTAIRMLDNVIDINFYPTEEARNSNLKHRPIGLGLMGFQDTLFQQRLPFDSPAALELADRIQEIVSLNAIMASSQLARERGAYPSYRGSKWSRGLFPYDTIALLEQERGRPIDVSKATRLDWTAVRKHVAEHGMRNSNTMAIAPTATISNIAGCFPCIEPIYKNIYVKANISGEFTVVNHYLVEDLKAEGLWNREMLDKLKYFDGNISLIPEIPDEMKRLYKEAFEVDPIVALRLTAVRAKWIDQSQSHNVFMKGASGKQLSEIYLAAWNMGLKTTYYLRTLAASQIEKSTLDAAKYGFTQKREYAAGVAAAVAASAAPSGVGQAVVSEPADGEPVTAEAPAPVDLVAGEDTEPKLCRLEDPDCEACQ